MKAFSPGYSGFGSSGRGRQHVIRDKTPSLGSRLLRSWTRGILPFALSICFIYFPLFVNTPLFVFFSRFGIVMLLLLDKGNRLLELAGFEWILYINHCRRARPADFRKRCQIVFSKRVARVNNQCAFHSPLSPLDPLLPPQ